MIKSLSDSMDEWESGTMGESQTAELFQELIDTRMVWNLKGQYGREAMLLIKEGLCHEREVRR